MSAIKQLLGAFGARSYKTPGDYSSLQYIAQVDAGSIGRALAGSLHNGYLFAGGGPVGLAIARGIRLFAGSRSGDRHG